MVVVAIIALAAGVFVMGYNIVFSKQLDSEVGKINDWLEAVAESAVLQSSVLGVRVEDNLFEVVAYYDNRWFLINGFESYEVSEDMRWEIETEEKIEFGQSLDEIDQAREPFVAFLPSGQALPEGTLRIHLSGSGSAGLQWDQNADFALIASEEDQ